MSEINTSPEVIKNPYTGIRFEPAQHRLIGKDNFSEPYFNQEVAKRLALYQPQVLTIEGLPNTLGLGMDEEKDIPFLTRVIPGPIETVYGKHTDVYVIASDNFETAAAAFTTSLNDDAYSKDAGERLKKEMYATLPEFATKPAIYASVLLVGLAIDKFSTKTEEKMSRRNFLKIAGKTVAAAGSAAFLAQLSTPFAATMTTTEESRDHVLSALDTIDQLIQPTKQKIINGRTAEQIAQTQDTIDHLGLPKNTDAAVMMGFMHSFNARQLLNDPQERDSAIRELFKIHKQSTIETCKQLKLSAEETGLAVNVYLPELFKRINLLKVSTQKPHKLTNMVTFYSPQISSAIQTVQEV